MNLLKNLKCLSILFIIVSLLSSCSEEMDLLEDSGESINITDIDGSEDDSNSSDPDDSEGDDDNGNEEDDDDSDEEDEDNDDDLELEFLDCFDLLYPVTFDLPDGTQLTVNDEDELESQLELYYETNPDEEEIPVPVFPISVILEDESELTISNLEELLIICEDEYDDDDDDDDEADEEDEDESYDDCFDLVFPLSFILQDGTEHTPADEDEAEMILDAFYEANPDVEEEPQFVFPIQIEYEDGTIETINSEEELELAEDNC